MDRTRGLTRFRSSKALGFLVKHLPKLGVSSVPPEKNRKPTPATAIGVHRAELEAQSRHHYPGSPSRDDFRREPRCMTRSLGFATTGASSGGLVPSILPRNIVEGFRLNEQNPSRIH